MKKTIQKKIHIYILVILSSIVILSFGISYFLRMMEIKKINETLSCSAADFAEIEIDADYAKKCLTTRKTDKQYTDTVDKLSEYVRENENILQISMINYSESVGYCIFDSSGQKLGKKIQYNEYTSSVKRDLIDGNNEWQITQKGNCITYRPVRTSDNKVAGYIVVTESYPYVNNIFWILIIISAIVIAIVYIISKVFSMMINREVFDPIYKFSKTALDFTGHVSNSGEINISEMFNTETNDEIGYLGNAIQKMISDINNSTENLSNAIFEATHDGMTQVFNKRHYNNMLSNFRDLPSICVIYFDVNNLKLMNDTSGHDDGDKVIKNAADYIRKIMPASGMCFRMGGDEFLIVISNCMFKEMNEVIEKIESDSPVMLSHGNDKIKCSLSYGYAYAKGSYKYEELLCEAEENMYKKKNEIKKMLNMPER